MKEGYTWSQIDKLSNNLLYLSARDVAYKSTHVRLWRVNCFERLLYLSRTSTLSTVVVLLNYEYKCVASSMLSILLGT